jgi:TetR/AcrR family transcriptional regulator
MVNSVRGAAVRARSGRPARGRAPRDPEGTRARVLEASLKEFSEFGLAGARVDRIARRAGVNKRMLYHYFGDKEQLFREILRRKVRANVARLAATPDEPADLLLTWFRFALEDVDWVRLVEWEALQRGGRPVVAEEERRAALGRVAAHLRARQDKGFLAPDLDPRHLLLTMISMTVFPVAFPQLTRLVTGLPPDHPAFQLAHGRFLRRAATAFAPVAPRRAGDGSR